MTQVDFYILDSDSDDAAEDVDAEEHVQDRAPAPKKSRRVPLPPDEEEDYEPRRRSHRSHRERDRDGKGGYSGLIPYRNGLALAAYYGDGRLTAEDVAAGLVGAVIKDPVQDRTVWLEYLETVIKEREAWGDLYRACRNV